MKKHIITISIVLTAFFSLESYAQNSITAYFLDNYLYGYTINPAKDNDEGFVGFAVSNIGANINGNVGLGSFFFPTDNGLLTGLNKQVPSSTFLGGLEKRNLMGLDLNEGLIAVGFKTKNSYNTIEMNLRSTASIDLPYEMFELLKVGPSSGVSSIPNLNLGGRSYLEIAWGHSREINEKLRVGMRAKALIGAMGIDMNMDNMVVSLEADEWRIGGKGQIAIAGPFTAKTNNGVIDLESIDLDENSKSLGGLGVAFDLGATYELIDGLTLSAAILDLGGISWKNSIVGETDNNIWSYTGSESGTGGNDDDLSEAFDDMFQFKQKEGNSSFKMLPMTINLGATYKLPFYKRATVGMIAQHRANGVLSWTDVRLGASVTPINLIGIAATAGMTTYGMALGGVLNIYLSGLNLFIGADSLTSKFSPEFIPIEDGKTNLTFGVNFRF